MDGKTPLIEGRSVFPGFQRSRWRGKSGFEHSPERIWIGGKGERPKAMSCGNFLYFCLHSKGTEENGQCASISNGVHQAFAVGVITVDYNCLERLARDSVLDRVLPSQEPRLQITKLYH